MLKGKGLVVGAKEPDSPRAVLDERLARRTRPADLATVEDGLARCTACAHRCAMSEGRAGACGVRFVREGLLRAPYGYVSRWSVGPVEANTVYHVHPGKLSLTFGMFGGDLECSRRHDLTMSQPSREHGGEESPLDLSAEDIADGAVATGCAVVCAAYNEPMVAAEWVRTVFAECRSRGLTTAIVSDGRTTPEALAYVRDATDVLRVELNGSDVQLSKPLGGRVQPVLDVIRLARGMGLWVEVATLVVPGINDREAVIKRIADTLVAVDPSIPWHLGAFHPRHKMSDRPPPSAVLLASMAGTAQARGMRHVYVRHPRAARPELEHTRCPSCYDVLIERRDYRAWAVRLRAGACPRCFTTIDGVWSAP